MEAAATEHASGEEQLESIVNLCAARAKALNIGGLTCS